MYFTAMFRRKAFLHWYTGKKLKMAVAFAIGTSATQELFKLVASYFTGIFRR